jgi:hypothetical protein
LPERKSLLFCNEIKTDGYSCRLSFAGRKRSQNIVDDPDVEARGKVDLVGKIYSHLKHRASLGELCLLNTDEYFTSQVSTANVYFNFTLSNIS